MQSKSLDGLCELNRIASQFWIRTDSKCHTNTQLSVTLCKTLIPSPLKTHRTTFCSKDLVQDQRYYKRLLKRRKDIGCWRQTMVRIGEGVPREKINWNVLLTFGFKLWLSFDAYISVSEMEGHLKAGLQNLLQHNFESPSYWSARFRNSMASTKTVSR